MKKDYIGFGFNPKENENHFYVILPKDKASDVEIFERFHWDEGKQVIRDNDILKLKISRQTWESISEDITREFNKQLRQIKNPIGKFTINGTPVEKRMGKELVMLLWGIENKEPISIPTAICNWLGLLPEERWWLYTMTNASTGSINDSNRGWRMALRYILDN